MFEILLIIAPVFIIIMAGYVSCSLRYIRPETSDVINALSIKFTLPVLLFQAMYHLDFSQVLNGPMLFGFYCGAIASFVTAGLLGRLLWKRRPGEAVAVGFCAFFTNGVLLGLPIVERAFGAEALNLGYGIISIHTPIVYSIGMISMELARRDGAPLGVTIQKTLTSIFSNPLMVGLLLGIFSNQVGLSFPKPLMVAVDMVAEGALPIAIFGVGVALTRYRIKSEIFESLVISAIALIVYPAVVFVMTHYLFALPKIYVQASVTIAAMPAGFNIYIFASLYNRAMGLAASVLLLSTLLSVISISLWLQLLQSL